MKTKDKDKVTTPTGSLQVGNYCVIQFHNYETSYDLEYDARGRAHDAHSYRQTTFVEKRLPDDEACGLVADTVTEQAPLLEEDSRRELARLMKDMLIKQDDGVYHFSVVVIAQAQIHGSRLELTFQSAMSVRDAQNNIIVEKTTELPKQPFYRGDPFSCTYDPAESSMLHDELRYTAEQIFTEQVQNAVSIAKSLAENGMRMEDAQLGQEEEKEEIPFA